MPERAALASFDVGQLIGLSMIRLSISDLPGAAVIRTVPMFWLMPDPKQPFDSMRVP
jgi:hypothetical protein